MGRQQKLLFFILPLLACMCQLGYAKFPASNVKPCKFGDEKCFKDFISTFADKHPSGLPALDIPTLDPFKFEEITIGSDGGPVSLKVTMKNTGLHGFKKMQVKEVKGFEKDFNGKTLTIQFAVPVLEVKGDLTVKGQVMVLPINGDGKGYIKFTDAVITAKCKVKATKKNGKDYLEVEKVKLEVEVKKMHVDSGGTIKDKTMAKTIDKVMNENWSDVYSALRPSIEEKFANVVKNLLNKVFAKAPYADLFAP